MIGMVEWGRQSRAIGDAKIGGAWAKIGRSHYRRETGEEVKKDGSYWDIIVNGKPGDSYLSRYEAMYRVDKKY